MKPTFAVCAALVGLLALSQSAIAEQKTARQCNDDWSANKASIQASGKTKRVFMAECRGVPLAAPASATAPTEKGQYASEAEAKASCPSDVVVWVNSASKIYYSGGSRSYGKTRVGAYMCEKDSVAAGFRAPKPRGAASSCPRQRANVSERYSVVTAPLRRRHRSNGAATMARRSSGPRAPRCSRSPRATTKKSAVKKVLRHRVR